jgi:hypothetical protein
MPVTLGAALLTATTDEWARAILSGSNPLARLRRVLARPHARPRGYSRSMSTPTLGSERPRLLVLDLLESYARERDIHVLLERRSEQDEWVCVLKWNGIESRWVGKTAREAIMDALHHEGVYTPD